MTKQARPAFISLLRRRYGADGETLRVAMGRKYRVTRWTLNIVAAKYGYEVTHIAGRDGLMHYRFIIPAA